MPSTITTYYTFVPATKARSSQVNTNFSNYRGDLLPIEENTAAASHLTHQLGGPDHRWDNIYGDALNLRGGTTTTNPILQAQTGVTAGATELLHGANTVVVFDVDGFTLKGSTSTADPVFKVNQAVTTGSMDLLFGSNTVSSWSSLGLARKTIAPTEYTTSSGGLGQYVITGVTNIASTLNTTLTVATIRVNARANSIIRFQPFATRLTTTNVYKYITFSLLRGSTTTSLSTIYTQTLSVLGVTVAAGANHQEFIRPYYDNSYTAGEVVYQLNMIADTNSAASITAAFIVGEII
jgi:hypothetical protein